MYATSRPAPVTARPGARLATAPPPRFGVLSTPAWSGGGGGVNQWPFPLHVSRRSRVETLHRERARLKRLLRGHLASTRASGPPPATGRPPQRVYSVHGDEPQRVVGERECSWARRFRPALDSCLVSSGPFRWRPSRLRLAVHPENQFLRRSSARGSRRHVRRGPGRHVGQVEADSR